MEPASIHECSQQLPTTVGPCQPEWKTETVVALAGGIVLERAFDRMPILADALEEAGCQEQAVLLHCRSQSEHDIKCWVLGWLEAEASWGMQTPSIHTYQVVEQSQRVRLRKKLTVRLLIVAAAIGLSVFVFYILPKLLGIPTPSENEYYRDEVVNGVKQRKLIRLPR